MPNPIVDKAREYLGTPFHFGGRLKGVGVDCGGLVACVASDLGLKVDIPTCCTRAESLRFLLATLEDHAIRAQGPRQAGDILVFAGRQMPGHCGLYTGEGTFIHAYDSPAVRAVVETPLDERWLDRLVRIYRMNLQELP